MTDAHETDKNGDRFDHMLHMPSRMTAAALDTMIATILFTNGMMRSYQDFLAPFLIAANSFGKKEKEVIPEHSVAENLRDYLALLRFNLQIADGAVRSSLMQMNQYYKKESRKFIPALVQALWGVDGDPLDDYTAEKVEALRRLVVDYPDAIREIGEDFGFHFDKGGYTLVGETDRMSMYSVHPTDPNVHTNPDGKPILIAHPYVLGSGILAFLPSDNKSYVHAFANQGIPTYVRIIKDISVNSAVQVMTGEDDALDTARLCRILKEIHKKPVTLNGFCQGGFICLLDLLSGELDGLVDALITCVAPMDGTRSKGLVEYLEHIAPRFRNLAYASKTMPSGNEVIDGTVMSWVYKLKSIEREAPIFTYYRDINLFETMLSQGVRGVGRTAAAINHWLLFDRNDLPVAITQMSFDSYTIPVTSSGDLPVKLFGRRLNFHYLQEKGIKFQICYAAKDDLVDPASALAPKDYIDVELTEFPKGHAAIATSWSDPTTEFGLHKRYSGGRRGPVRFQLDMDEELASHKTAAIG
jgi:hypothetical protein